MTVNQSSIQTVRNCVMQAAQRAQRNPDEITLIAVSKQKPITNIVTAYQMGIRHFGENRTDELTEKAVALAHLTDLKWHFIGHLQSRQSQTVAQYAHYFHAVDSVKIAERLSMQLLEFNRQLSIFIQVNISGETSKSGFDCQQWQTQPQLVEALIQPIEYIKKLPNLSLQGLMTMAPWDVPETVLRYVFASTTALIHYLRPQLPNSQQLSMGMTDDFEIAIEEGATHVRIGRAIFGEY